MESLEGQQLALLDVINDILTMTALEAEVVLPLRITSQPLSEILLRLFAAVRYSAEQQGVSLIVYPPHTDWHQEVNLSIDAARVFQILLNLVGNSIKFTARGGRVVVDARVFCDPDAAIARVVLTVEDTGCGIPQEVLDRVQELDSPRLGKQVLKKKLARVFFCY